MPLLKKQPFIRKEIPKDLEKDGEVFFCPLTKEVFTDYEEFFERVIVCNSLVWTCSISGRFGLTYQEALESEEKALKCLESFPDSLQRPILYIASLTQRTTLNDMCDDVFLFARDRYFIGENVQVTSGSSKKTCSIIKVIAPTKEEIQKNNKNSYISNPNETNDKNAHPHAHLYRYLVKDCNMPNSKSSVVKAHNIGRPKGMFTRVKNKLFLKQHTTLNNKVRVVKNEFVKKYGLDAISFANIFANEVPGFLQAPKKLTESSLGDNESGEDNSLDGKTTKSMLLVSQEHSNDNSKNNSSDEDPEIQKVLEAERRKHEREQEKEKKKEEQRLKLEHAKLWNKARDDLECDDLKPLPRGCTLPTQLNANCFADVLTILEFVHIFGELLDAKENFPDGLTFSQVERAILGKETNGAYLELLQFLLASIFHLQSGEEHSNEFVEDTEEMMEELKNQSEPVKQATLSSGLSLSIYGQPLRDLAIEGTNVTEIVRLHLLASGGLAHQKNALYRYQQRGAYGPRDDPGLELKTKHPEIIRHLEFGSVFELTPDHKTKLLCTFINQLLTFVTLREFIEDNLEKVRLTKMDMRSQNATTTNAAPTPTPKESPVAEPQNLGDKLDTFQKSGATMTLGRDRAFRRYWLLSSVPGLYVEDSEQEPGLCMDVATPVTPHRANQRGPSAVKVGDASNEALDVVVKDIVDELLSRVEAELGLGPGLGGPPRVCGAAKTEDVAPPDGLGYLACTAEPATCPLHSPAGIKARNELAGGLAQASAPDDRPIWEVYCANDHFTGLLNAFNKRGFRERHTRNVFLAKKAKLLDSMSLYQQKQPLRAAAQPSAQDYRKAESARDEAQRQALAEGDLAEILLDLEDRIYVSGLGRVAVSNRTKWRTSLEHADYHNSVFKEGLPDSDYRLSLIDAPLEPSVIQNLKALAGALVQIGRGIETRFLQEPLGEDEPTKQTRLKSLIDANIRNGESFAQRPDSGFGSVNSTSAPPTSTFVRWESHVLSSHNLSQLYLHCFTLDHCVSWSKSLLKVRCKVCRKKSNPEQLLLCDGCNKGHHTFCIKPKIKKIPAGDWFCPSCKKVLMPDIAPKPQADASQAKYGVKLINGDIDDNDGDDDVIVEDGDDFDAALTPRVGTVACLDDNSDASSTGSNTTPYRPTTGGSAKDDVVLVPSPIHQRKNPPRDQRQNLPSSPPAQTTSKYRSSHQRPPPPQPQIFPNSCSVCGGDGVLSSCTSCHTLVHHPQCSVSLDASNISKDRFTCPTCIATHKSPIDKDSIKPHFGTIADFLDPAPRHESHTSPREDSRRPTRGRGSRGGGRPRGRATLRGGRSRSKGIDVIDDVSPARDDVDPTAPGSEEVSPDGKANTSTSSAYSRSGRKIKRSSRYDDIDVALLGVGVEPEMAGDSEVGAKKKRPKPDPTHHDPTEYGEVTSPSHLNDDDCVTLPSDDESQLTRPPPTATRGRGGAGQRPRGQGKRTMNGYNGHFANDDLNPYVNGIEIPEAGIKTFSRSFDNSFNREQRIREEIVQNLKKHVDSWPFLKAVSKVKVPDYYTIVKEPMDLGTLKCRVDDLKYPDMRSFVTDVRLIFHNCWLYNQESTPEYKAAQSLEAFFKRRLVDFDVAPDLLQTKSSGCGRVGGAASEVAKHHQGAASTIDHKFPIISIPQQHISTNGILPYLEKRRCS